jgi:hypothetical protein
MHSEWFNGIEILQGRWQRGEKVGYCYPSGLGKTLCKWDTFVPLVTKELNEVGHGNVIMNMVQITSCNVHVTSVQIILQRKFDAQRRCCSNRTIRAELSNKHVTSEQKRIQKT